MSLVQAHYETLLAEHYTWMFGVPFEQRVAQQRQLLEPLLPGVPLELAVDLGCGPGFQSFALAQLGAKQVLALDSSPALLRELDSRKGNLPIAAILCELPEISFSEASSAQLMVCMGDTITHLNSRADVQKLFGKVRRILAPGGVFVLTYRDLTTIPSGLDRFLPIRSDERKIMTCFLEEESAEVIRVHDLIHTRSEQGWTLQKSSYPKLRLPTGWMQDSLTAARLKPHLHTPANGMQIITATCHISSGNE
jgi:SAM-dependent methyltransferase